MSPSLIFVDKEGSEVASSPQPGPPARIGPVLHLLCESKPPNKALLLSRYRGRYASLVDKQVAQ
jgi:hypothetical protein